MKNHVIACLFAGATLLSAASLTAADQPASASQADGQLIKLEDKTSAWAVKARKEYPLDVCVTSDEKLGSMGDSPEYVYRQPGRPDRLVIFCCEGCEDDFKKEPAKYLARLDAAAKAKKKSP